jgi:hypothetical protein
MDVFISHCPLCGFGPLRDTYVSVQEFRYSFDLCPCCGCEYGYDDTLKYFDEWLAGGCRWFNPGERSADWSLDKQVANQIRPWPPVGP